MGKRRQIKKILTAFCLVFSLLLSGQAVPAKAADTAQQIANLVVFVRYTDDTEKDVFNASRTVEYEDGRSITYSNWQTIKNMYDKNEGQEEKDNSFKSYISSISEGKVEVNNIFPQEKPDDSGVNTLTLSSTATSYTQDTQIISEVIAAFEKGSISLGTSAGKLDNLETGFVDNLTIVVQGNGSDKSSIIYPHRAQYGGTGTIGGLKVFNYNVIPSRALVEDDASISTGQQQGVIAHEFLHTIGFPDLYRASGVGTPVGTWDVMASNSCCLQYPLSYLRAEQGWIEKNTITSAGTYTLTAVTEKDGNQVYVIQTPLSETEYIVLEYRRKDSSNYYAFDHQIPSDGLLMYRVDTKIDNHTNINGDNYIYVYRPDVSDPEAAAESVNNAALKSGSYGSTDLSKSYTENTLYYSDGRNSGVMISNLSYSTDKSQITFQVSFADYDMANLWENVGSIVSDNADGTPELCIDQSNGNIYVASASGAGASGAVSVKYWNGGTWAQLGATVTAATEPKLAVCDGELYLSYIKSGNWHPVYCKWTGSSWSVVEELQVDYPYSMQFIVDGSNLYTAYAESLSNGTQKLVIRDLKNKTLVCEDKTTGDFSNPAVCKVGKQFYLVYSDFWGTGSGKLAKVEVYDTSKKTWSVAHQFSASGTNMHLIGESNGKIYVFAGGNSMTPVFSVYDGAQWVDTSVSQMKSYLDVSMNLMNDEVYLSYIDTDAKKASVLKKNGDVFDTCYDNLETGLSGLKTDTYGNAMYAAVHPENSSKIIVKKMSFAASEYSVKVTPPSGYTDANIYIDGIAYGASFSGGSYSVKLTSTDARTAVMYRYDANGIPTGMYAWSLDFSNDAYSATPLTGLENLLSYHGFSIRVQSPAGIRFKSGIDVNLKNRLLSGGVDGYKLVEYGTLFMTDSNRGSYPFVLNGAKTGSARSYWTENGVTNDKVFETVGGRCRFASVLIGLPAAQYNTNMAFRAYIILDNGSEQIVLYGPPVSRSIYTVAKQVDAKGEFPAGSSGFNYVRGIISSVEGK